MEAPDHLLIFTRWDNVYMRIELGKRLKKKFPDAKLQFATVNYWAHLQVENAGAHSIYLLDRMQRCDPNAILPNRKEALDKAIYEETGATLNMMTLGERARPRNGKKVEEMRDRHLVVLDEIVQSKTLMVHETCDSMVYWLASSLVLSRGGWNFSFISCGIPSNTVLGMRTAWTRWLASGALSPDITVAEQQQILAEPVAKRMGYMNQKTMENPLDWFRYQFMVFRYCLIDAWHGSLYWSFKAFIPNLIGKLWRHLKRCIPVKSTIRSEREINELEAPFVYFPLQMEPEASILGYSPWFHDQQEAIRLICQSMPVTWKILVKENPKMAGARPFGYYKKLLSMPGVELVDIRVPTYPLLKNARSVAAISGTATFEGRILGKPTFSFGSPPFHSLLTDSDIAGRANMRDWFKKLLRETQPPLTDQDFNDWKKSVFQARGSMFWQGRYRGMDASKENVSKYVAFILDVLENPIFNEVP